MFMESLKNIVITLITVLIFISAVELISPNNKMKKYINFILGLILITVILNPIVKFVSSGEKTVLDSINKYEEMFSENKSDSNNEIKSDISDKQDNKKKLFIDNFNKNCNQLLKDKFKNMTFKSEVDCDIDFNNVNITIKKLRIGVNDSSISKVKKVVINKEQTENTNEKNEKYSEIINFVSDELNISKEKIEVYQLEE